MLTLALRVPSRWAKCFLHANFMIRDRHLMEQFCSSMLHKYTEGEGTTFRQPGFIEKSPTSLSRKKGWERNISKMPRESDLLVVICLNGPSIPLLLQSSPPKPGPLNLYHLMSFPALWSSPFSPLRMPLQDHFSYWRNHLLNLALYLYHSFIYSFKKYLLSANYVLGTKSLLS